ncbi:MAG: PhnD/SsuA/transferrin family substrate-binding protein [Phycisphaerales bacterium]|nr:PhnD/SsuA/transferrin family substrate-binding protein [Phycisphaerales bacterium]
MNSSFHRTTLVTLAVGAALVAGCQSTGTHVISRLAFQKEPLVVAVVVDSVPEAAAAPVSPFTTYAPLQAALSKAIDRPVALEPCFAFQAEQGIATGWYSLAVVTPAQYARTPAERRPRILAVSSDPDGDVLRSALLVTATTSAIQGPADLRGKIVAFGPRDDSLLHHGALKLLRDNGIQPSDLQTELLPVPGSLRHLPDARTMAHAVATSQVAAGFIDEDDYNALPEQSTASGETGRQDMRVIGRTMGLPTRLLLVGHNLDPDTAARVQAFLVRVGREQPEVLKPLRARDYRVPTEDVLAACGQLEPDPATALPLPFVAPPKK